MLFTIEIEQEADGRWIAEVIELPGAMVYAATAREALAGVKVLALRIIGDRIEHNEMPADVADFRFVQAA